MSAEPFHPARHNDGPPLETPHPWGEGPVGRYYDWKAAVDAAWKSIPPEIAIRRAKKAEAIGLTYAEYTLEILERGRYLCATDAARIAEIKLRRPLRY
jgi:hypothetical protein